MDDDDFFDRMKVTVVLVVNFLALMCAALVGSATTARSKNRGKGSMWWGIAKAGEPNNISPISPGVLLYMDDRHPDPLIQGTLRRRQSNLAQANRGLLDAVAKGANNAIHECQHQFRNQRWNCSTRNFLRGKNLFGKIVDKGCRETAFIYAITSAAVTHAIARACSDGSIDTCSCEPHSKGRPQVSPGVATVGVRDFAWGGCSDNIGFGFAISREFVDTGERGKTLREKMNLHNNEAGRWHVQSQMRQECKCHGMSGSCTVKTCWMRLPPFRVIGDLLKDRFDGASHVAAPNAGRPRSSNSGHSNRPNRPAPMSGNSIHSKRESRRRKYGIQLKPFNPEHKPPSVKDLVYFEVSPVFCERNPKLGIQGTHGRICNETSLGVDGCDIMCCGRGYTKTERVVHERCNCTFHWCCEVKCDTCTVRKTEFTCM